MGITATIIHIRLIFAVAVIICAAHHVQGCRYWQLEYMLGFRCANGQCIRASFKCNGLRDCQDGSDETTETCGANCEEVRGGGFACSDGQCIWVERKCDGRRGCRDGSDETTETCGDNCGGVNFRCANGQCIRHGLKCDGNNNCGDGSDEDQSLCGSEIRYTLDDYPEYN